MFKTIKGVVTYNFQLYPCRIGTAGYVYDKVSNTILGDGRLTPGPDSADQTPWNPEVDINI